MRSIKFRRLIEGFSQLSEDSNTVKYIFKLAEIVSECRIEIWHEKQLQQLYSSKSIRSILKSFEESIQLPGEMLGKKSSQIHVSGCGKYCIKNISEEDFQKLQKMLKFYLQYKQKEQRSGIIDLYAVFIVESRPLQHKNKWIDYFILMPNLSISSKGVIYDLKGHCDSRFISPQDLKDFHFGKDQNFVASDHKDFLAQSPLVKQFLQTLETDLHFLRKQKVIDYSLLLSFDQNETEAFFPLQNYFKVSQNLYVRWTIIDFLQTFNDRKKLEHKLKSLFYKEISSVDPQTYADRLLDFLLKHLAHYKE